MTEELFPSKYEKDFSFTVAIVFMKDQIVKDFYFKFKHINLENISYN